MATLKLNDMSKNNGGPAFPVDGQYASDALKHNTQGMSKRFYAACAAMQGILAHSGYYDDKGIMQGFVHRAYIIADELLKQENE